VRAVLCCAVLCMEDLHEAMRMQKYICMPLWCMSCYPGTVGSRVMVRAAEES
jgi:hypothetical protein